MSWRKWSISGTGLNMSSSSFGPMTATCTSSVITHPCRMGIGSWCRFGRPDRHEKSSTQHSALSIQHGFNAPDQSFAAAIPLRTGITNLRISPQTVSSEISATWFFLEKAAHCFLLSTSSKKSSYEHNRSLRRQFRFSRCESLLTCFGKYRRSNENSRLRVYRSQKSFIRLFPIPKLTIDSNFSETTLSDGYAFSLGFGKSRSDGISVSTAQA
jgi:hypothetical protein